jgi:hypothetical protein
MTSHASIPTGRVGTGPAALVDPAIALLQDLAAANSDLAEMGAFDGAMAAERRHRLVAAVRQYDRGNVDDALDRIGRLLEAHPRWADGHAAMAQLLSQTGSLDAFEQFLVHALRRTPGDMAMVTTCLRMLSEAGLHETVDALLPELRAWAGDHLFFTLIEAVAASEGGDAPRADALFARAARQGGVLSLPHARHLIRTGDALKAATIVEAFVRNQPAHQGAWGLLATAWRLTGDSRHEWLVERPGMVRLVAVDVAPEALASLAVRLRRFHVARFHPFDQSLRGGTQTAGRILHRDDPEIRAIRRAFMTAVRNYLDLLPPPDPRHPLLGRDRTRFAFTDSWSVRLTDGGYHVSHFHPRGTVSSAFYVTLPPPCAERPQSGWLTIGEPPEDLCTGLPPLRMIEPVAGHLALFPSFMWHGTRPFPAGERMTLAFDTLLGG